LLLLAVSCLAGRRIEKTVGNSESLCYRGIFYRIFVSAIFWGIVGFIAIPFYIELASSLRDDVVKKKSFRTGWSYTWWLFLIAGISLVTNIACSIGES
jgi:surface polysaccharide O-acyltransferase-like enzyme